MKVGKSKFSAESLVFILMGVFFFVLSLIGSYFAKSNVANGNLITINNFIQQFLQFGFNQLQNFSVFASFACILAIVGLILIYRINSAKIVAISQKIEGIIYKNQFTLILFSLILGLIFFGLRSNFANRDMQDFRLTYPDYANRNITFIQFDEMWESYLHHQFYILTHHLFGWSVDLSMQIFSCVIGIFFIYLILHLCREFTRQKPLLGFMLIISGGFMQLFFGDMEQYTLTAGLIALFILTSIYYIRGKIPLVAPSLVWIVTITSHMATVYLFPGVLFLFILELRKCKYLSMLFSTLFCFTLFNLILLFFMNEGAFLQRLLETSWGLGRGGSVLANINRFDWNYLIGQINLLFLIYPLIWMVIPIIVFGNLKDWIRNNYSAIFLAIISACGFIFFFIWRSSIGLYDDWNLFSIPLIPMILLIASNLSQLKKYQLRYEFLIFAVGWAFLQSYSWILSNHYL